MHLRIIVQRISSCQHEQRKARGIASTLTPMLASIIPIWAVLWSRAKSFGGGIKDLRLLRGLPFTDTAIPVIWVNGAGDRYMSICPLFFFSAIVFSPLLDVRNILLGAKCNQTSSLHNVVVVRSYPTSPALLASTSSIEGNDFLSFFAAIPPCGSPSVAC